MMQRPQHTPESYSILGSESACAAEELCVCSSLGLSFLKCQIRWLSWMLFQVLTSSICHPLGSWHCRGSLQFSQVLRDS